jgi:hypothetical protein
VEAADIQQLERPFSCRGNVATAAAAEQALSYVAPVGQATEYVARARGVIGADLEAAIK